MWMRYSRLIWIALFIWVVVLGSRSGSWKLVIVPFLGLGALLIVQEKLRRIYPDFGSKLAGSLSTLIIAFNIYASIPTLRNWLTSQFPDTASATRRRQEEVDLDTAEKLEPAEIAAREALHAYLLQKEDIVGQQIKAELDSLNAKRQKGTFGPNDEKAEEEVLNQFQELVKERKELQRVVTVSASTEQPKGSAVAQAADSQSEVLKEPTIHVSQRSEANQSSPQLVFPAPSTLSPASGSGTASAMQAVARENAPSTDTSPVANFDNGYLHLSLWRCEHAGSQVQCAGKIEIAANAPPNYEDGTVLVVFHRFKISDETAAQYAVSAGVFGNARCMGTGYCWQKMTPGIAAQFSFIVDHVNPASGQLNIVMPNNKGEDAVFRAVPIQ